MKYLLWLLVVLLAAGSCRILLHNPLNNDVSWYLYVAQELLAGKHLYKDIIETNPPLICFLSVIPVLIAKIPGVAAKPVWIVLITALIVCLSTASAALWSRSRAARPGESGMTLIFLLIISLAYFFAFASGQRDHLAFVAGMTVAAMISARVASVPVSTPLVIALSVIAGLLLALKPFFLIPWFLCTIYAIRVLSWRTVARFPETYLVPGMSLVQLFLVVFVTPSYYRVARLVSDVYSSFARESWTDLLTGRFMFAAIVGTALVFLYRPSPRSRHALRVASLTAAGWVLSGLLQRKGWHYHVLPALASVAFGCWLILLDVTTRSAGPLRRSSWLKSRMVLQAAAILLLLFAGYRTVRLRWEYSPAIRGLNPVVAREAHGGDIVGLDTGMFAFPLVNDTHVRFSAHYNCLWPLPGLYADQIGNGKVAGQWHYRRLDQMGTVEKGVFEEIYSDLAAQPRLVIIAKASTLQGMGALSVNLEDYFLQDVRIRDVLSHYEPVPAPDEYLVLRHRETSARK